MNQPKKIPKMQKPLEVIFTSTGFSIENDFERQFSQDASSTALLYRLAFTEHLGAFPDCLVFLHQVGIQFLKDLTRNPDLEITRTATALSPSEDALVLLLDQVPFSPGRDFVDEAWITKQYANLVAHFNQEILAFDGTVASYLEAHNASINVVGRVIFHLVESGQEKYPFAFLATYSHLGQHLPLKNALLEYQADREKLLALLGTVSKAGQRSSFMGQLIESGELMSPLKFSVSEAHTFLREIPLYESCGILCRMPNWWQKRTQHIKLSLSLGDRQPAVVGMESLISFDASLHLGGEIITEDEARAILAQAQGLAMIKGKWVEVDHKKLEATLLAYERAKVMAQRGYYTLAEAMRLVLSAKDQLGAGSEDVSIEVSHGEWLRGLTGFSGGAGGPGGSDSSDSTGTSGRPEIMAGPHFHATLRPYQQLGLQWLNTMIQYGFGACLADDMGLGKTVQIIALLEYYRQKSLESGDPMRVLLAMPASLMGNWQRELQRFAPNLGFNLIYSAKDIPEDEGAQKSGVSLVLTTYGMVARLPWLQDQLWDLVIIDEAQAIKNSGTKQTKAIKHLQTKGRIALTGTPVENRLSDLWSLFDFLNCGLLGTAREFQAISKRLHSGQLSYSQLRQMVSPFILRRLKTDKSIIDSLPDKLEMKAYTQLTKKQVVLYQGLVKEIEKRLNEASDGENQDNLYNQDYLHGGGNAARMGRRGLVLSSLMKFKQICNHPDHYLGVGDGVNGYHHEHSGKFERLTEICQTIYEKRERVLVFTQFREMVEPLSRFLATIFEREGLTLHGGTPIKQRGDIVDHFNGSDYVPYMVLSLKAGGVGLNLTAANHVIHFDRWWNPAVENQATDRAYRIGQERDVMVHKLITVGTIEEKIDAMIEAKSQLSTDVIGESGEGWITELDNASLMDLFKLSI